MGKPCRVSFFAFKDNDSSGYAPIDGQGLFSAYDLRCGISYCEWLMEDFGMTHEWLDDFSLAGYIEWAQGLLDGA